MLDKIKTNSDKYQLTKLCIITDGISYDDIYRVFYHEVLKKIKSIGFSCNIVLIYIFIRISIIYKISYF